MRRIAGRLRPGLLEDLGLISSLNALATEFTSHTRCMCVAASHQAYRDVPRDRAGDLSVTQEALTNIARHARASTVQLSLSRQGHGVTLRIADDGVGVRDADAASGIQGMQERALLVGGKLSIEPRVGGGTEIRLAIPNGGRRDVNPTRILLADDHALVRHGVRMILDSEPDLSVVAEAGTASRPSRRRRTYRDRPGRSSTSPCR